jgi:leucyl-tRNA synthetase
MRRQLRRIGLGHDPAARWPPPTSDFYRWTQWIFTADLRQSWFDPEADVARPIAELVGVRVRHRAPRRPSLGRAERGRAPGNHRRPPPGLPAEMPVNWCPGLGTVLANEEVTADGRSDIGNFPVFKRNMRQWMMRITAYADRLLADLDLLDWPEPIKVMQRNWIGRSTGAQVRFASGRDIEVFTTRPDTLFGATFGAGPGAPAGRRCSPTPGPPTPRSWKLASQTSRPAAPSTPAEAVASYRTAASAKSDPGRGPSEDRRVHRLVRHQPGERRADPVFIADYVLMGYGTGAIMAVPATTSATSSSPASSACRSSRSSSPPTRGSRPEDRPTLDTVALAGGVRGRRRPTSTRPTTHLSLERRWHGRRGQGELINAWLEAVGQRRGHRSRTSCATGCSAASATGASRSPSCGTSTVSRTPCPTRCCRSSCPRRTDYSPKHLRPRRRGLEPRAAAGPRADEWVHVELDLGDGGGRPTAASQRDAAVGRIVLVRAALPGPDQRASASSTRRTSATGWARTNGATAGTRDPAASTCTSAASSTPCCTCCTPGSGTRCCSTWATCQ